MWVDVAESYVEANTCEKRKRFGKALDAAGLVFPKPLPENRFKDPFSASNSFSETALDLNRSMRPAFSSADLILFFVPSGCPI
jgi:hypothetical protein